MRSGNPHGSSSGKSEPPAVRAKASRPYERDISMGVLYVATRALVPAWGALPPTLVRSTSRWSPVAGQSHWCYSSILLAFDVFSSQWASFLGQLPCQCCSCSDHTNWSWSKSLFAYSELDSRRRGIRSKASKKRHLRRRENLSFLASLQPWSVLVSCTSQAVRHSRQTQFSTFDMLSMAARHWLLWKCQLCKFSTFSNLALTTLTYTGSCWHNCTITNYSRISFWIRFP